MEEVQKINELEHDIQALEEVQKELYQKLYNVDISLNMLRIQLNALR